MPNSEDLWASFGGQILKASTPSFDPATQRFSLATSTLSIDIGSFDPAVANNAIYILGNSIPASGPAYAPARALLTSYRAFLDAIDVEGETNPDLDRQIDRACSEMNAAQENFQSIQVSATAGWITYRQVDPAISFPDYIQQMYRDYLQAENALDRTTSSWQQLLIQKYGQCYEVIANARNRLSPTGGASDVKSVNGYNMQVKSASVAAAESTPSFSGLRYEQPGNAMCDSFAPSFALEGSTLAYYEWQCAAATNAPPAASIRVTSGDSAASWGDQGGSHDETGAFGREFIAIWADNTTSESAFRTSGAFEIEIDFVGLNSLALRAGGWFDPGLIQCYRDRLLPTAPDFFAVDGLLPHIPAQVVFGFQPRIKMKLSGPDYIAIKSAIETGGAIGIGPIVIGGTDRQAYAGASSIRFDDAGTTIVISPPDDRQIPVLLGVICDRIDV